MSSIHPASDNERPLWITVLTHHDDVVANVFTTKIGQRTCRQSAAAALAFDNDQRHIRILKPDKLAHSREHLRHSRVRPMSCEREMTVEQLVKMP
jgi:hypothetical protein